MVPFKIINNVTCYHYIAITVVYVTEQNTYTGTYLYLNVCTRIHIHTSTHM